MNPPISGSPGASGDPHPTDQPLLTRALPTAPPGTARLEALYDAHHRQAIGLSYQLLADLGEAEEVVQEVFLAAWRAAASYDAARGSERTWLLAMVRNRCIDHLRARKRRPVDSLDAHHLDRPDDSDVAAQAAASVDAAQACAALQQLPVEQRTVIELAYFAGLSHSEIAAQLATPIGTVKGRIRLAMDRLRATLSAPPGRLPA